jgi:hypothetical protein
MIHPIMSNVANTAVYYGATLATDKNTAPKTEVTNSSASAAARGNYSDTKVGITASSAEEVAKGSSPLIDKTPIKNVTPSDTIAAATASFNTPSVDISVTLKAESEKEFKEAKEGKTKETPATKAREALQANDALKAIASQERNFPSIITIKNSVSAESVISAYKQ